MCHIRSTAQDVYYVGELPPPQIESHFDVKSENLCGETIVLVPGVPGHACSLEIEREFSSDNLLVRIHSIIEMIRWTGLAP